MLVGGLQEAVIDLDVARIIAFLACIPDVGFNAARAHSRLACLSALLHK